MFEATPQPMMGNNSSGKANKAGKNIGTNTAKNYEQKKANN